MSETLDQLMSVGAPDDVAISAPDRASLSYAGLRDLIARSGKQLRALGIAREDAVAIVAPNGPEMATSFLAVASAAVSAPLNPSYQAAEFDFYLSDLDAKAVLVLEGDDTPVRQVANDKGIQVVELSVAADDPAGSFTMKKDGNAVEASGDNDTAGPDDIALVLHTSGTTSRPKIVPLSHRNVTASAGNIKNTLRLAPGDKCLNIMPLFHIHGLIAVILSSMEAGTEVCCTPGFNALKFFSWLDGEKPTWYSGVPTMHQAILARAPRNQDSVKASNLRFARSSSASLPPQVLKEVEETFGCPMIEAYGMTEAAHQMASNPLPPEEHKPGTVGKQAGPEVSIMNEGGEILAPGQTGEVVIRGSNVTPGYLNNPKANAEAFTDGWFRTGDQGVMDDEGYLTITGRLKEIINRGGEKISPREVDEVLMDHPAIAQVVTFAMPHDKLGEEVAAAAVFREGESVAENELRDFVKERLADFKVPRKILFLDEIPKGATGKLQRIGLAEKLGLV